MGCVFAPLVTVAMRNIDPRMAGAASGVLNTVRQVGLVIGTAAVGALLQNRLVTSMNSQAATRAAALPPQLRGPFVAGIKQAANNGIQVGAGQNGSGIKLPAGLPARLMAELLRIGHDVFTFGYVNAMRPPCCCPSSCWPWARSAACCSRRTGRPRSRTPAGPDGPAQADARRPDPSRAGRSPPPAGQLAGSKTSGDQSPGRSPGSASNGKRSANAGCRSVSQVASGS